MNLNTHRSHTLAPTFKTIESYIENISISNIEHLQVQLTILAQKYHKFPSEKDERFYRSKGISIYLEAQIKRVRSNDKESFILSFPHKENSSKYSKDDIWVISNSSKFDKSFIGISSYYGPSGNGTIELSVSNPKDLQIALQLIGIKTNDYIEVCAVRCFNASSELSIIESLQKHGPNSKLLTYLIDPMNFHDSLDILLDLKSAKVDFILTQIVESFNLNHDQHNVLQSVLNSLASDVYPTTLVHGVFGAGKSFVVCVLILLLDKLNAAGLLIQKDGLPFQIVLSSNTNGTIILI